MSVTLKDIAKRVGKSITTVSRALHDYDDVSPETKALVRQVAEELGYTPHTIAQRLQKKRSDTLGIVLPTFGPRFSDPFFSEFLAGVGNQAAELGYDLLVATRPADETEIAAYRQLVQGHRVDGFIIVRTRRQDPRIAFLRQTGFPFVAFGRTDGPLDFPFIDEDGAHGMHQVVSHLVAQGHRRIAFIGGPAELNFAHHRLQGFRQALRDHHIAEDSALIRHGDLTQKGGYDQTVALLQLPQPPTAIAAGNDLMAFGAISAAQDHGLVVGRDIAITGFDDIPLSEYVHPPLTTVHQPIYQIGRQLCQMLIERIQNPGRPRQIILQPELIIRQSSLKKGGAAVSKHPLPDQTTR